MLLDLSSMFMSCSCVHTCCCRYLPFCVGDVLLSSDAACLLASAAKLLSC